MKILHLAMHEGSGAGREALRLHQGLLLEKAEREFKLELQARRYQSLYEDVLGGKYLKVPQNWGI
jgi:hypothetical protein